MMECPRCGYDQRGLCDRWQDTCPMEGTCSECGLDYLWRDVLNPRFATPDWCIEFSRGFRETAMIILATFAMTARPWRFWLDLRMSHPIHPHRLALYMIVVPVAAYVMFALSVGYATGTSNKGLPGLPPVPTMAAGFLHGCVAPWSKTQTATGATPMVVADRYQFNLVKNTIRAVRSGTDDWGFGNREWMCSLRVSQGLCTVIACPLGFVALPISRRIAKVRWRHVFRVGAYGMVFVLIPIVFDLWSQMMIFITWRSTALAAIIMTAVLMAALSLWWSVATSRYLRMPHAWLVGPSVVALAYLFQWLLMATIDLSIDVIHLL